jgi:hypothetical protein
MWVYVPIHGKYPGGVSGGNFSLAGEMERR